ENKSLKSKISDLKRDVSLIYESTKEFLKERTDGLKAFKNVFKGFVDKVKDKTAQFQEKHDLEPKKKEFELTHNREVKKEEKKDIKPKKNEIKLTHNREIKKERSRDKGMSL